MKQIQSLFEALADENRLRIVNLLIASPVLCVADLQRVLDMPQTRVSRHLGYLKNRGLVSSDRKGTWMYYSLSEKIKRDKHLIASLRSMFSKSESALQDIELLLEGLDDNSIAALREAKPETVEFVIENCCNLGETV